MRHLLDYDLSFQGLAQDMDHRLPRRFGQMIPKLLELQRRLFLGARGGAAVRGSDIEFLLEFELLADTMRPMLPKPRHQQ